MRVIEGSGPIELAIVGCLHGNEVFGKTVFDYYENQLDDYPGIRLILANEEAYQQDVRYIDKDLNTVFPGDTGGNHEQRLAAQLMPFVCDVDMVLDLHTTSSDIEMVPITGSLDSGVDRIIQATRRKDIAQMISEIVAPSLIGNVRAGVSLEFGEVYATTDEALKEMSDIIEALLEPTEIKPLQRRIFKFDATIPLNTVLDKPASNFALQPTHRFYPFLFDEKSNEHDQGFAAYTYEERFI